MEFPAPVPAVLGFLFAAAGSCAAPPAVTAIAAVLAADDAAGTRRNQASETGPIAEAVRAYVADLDQLDLAACPADFARALRLHRDAWASMIPYLAGFAAERGEMHVVFDRLAAEDNPTAPRLTALLDEVWRTWGMVESAARRHGALPPG